MHADKYRPPWNQGFAWVEEVTGGRLVRAERQARWRPAWLLDVDVSGASLPLYWRGDRAIPGSAAVLRSEAKLLQELERHDIPVPHVHGLCEEPLGLLLERVDGDVDFHRADPDEQERVAGDFLDIVARYHHLDLSVAESAGLRRPAPGTEATASLRRWQAAVDHAGVPAPLLRLALWWLNNHAPGADVPAVLVHGDCGPGQFLFKEGRVTAVLDWEFAHIGDPMEDLALIRGRDLSYPFGDLRQRLAEYEARGGHRVDRDRLAYYSVLAMLISPAGLLPVLAAPPPGTDIAQVLAWNAVYSRALVQCLAEATGVELRPVDIPDAPPSPRGWLHETVVSSLRELAESDADPYERYRLESVALLADHLRLADHLGAAFDGAELDDAAEVLGRRPTDRAQADLGLDALVANAPGTNFEALLRLFHRRTVRDETLLTPLLGELAETAGLSPIGN